MNLIMCVGYNDKDDMEKLLKREVLLAFIACPSNSNAFYVG